MLDKAGLLQLFPTSLLSTTLDQDPSAEVIEITHRDVTPAILDMVKVMIDTDRVVSHDSSIPQDEYIRAGNYLNIDILTAMTDVNYNLFVQSHPLTNLLHIVDDDFDIILPFSATSGGYQLVWYLYRSYTDIRLFHESISNSMLVVASYSGSVDLVRLLLERKYVNPATASVNEHVYKKYMGISSEIIYPERNILLSTRNQALYFAILKNQLEVVRLLLQDPRVGYEGNESDSTYLLYRLLGEIHNYALFDLLIHNDRFNPNRISSDILSDPVKLAILLPYLDVNNYSIFWTIYNSNS